MGPDELTLRYAELAVRAGVNLRAGQHLLVAGNIEHAPMVRAVAEAGYRAGARYVEALYLDEHVRHSLIEHAHEDMLPWTPPYALDRYRYLAENDGALVMVSGAPDPHIFDDLDPARVAKARMMELAKEMHRLVSDRLINWCIIAQPTAGWAESVFGTPDLEKLWDAVARAARLYEDDPVAAWWARVEQLGRRAAALQMLDLEKLVYTGPDTDLTVGLIPQARWGSALFETAKGQKHIPNIPTEEVFTTPDYRLTEGRVATTKPVLLPTEGVLVENLKLTFQGGKVVDVTASSGENVFKKQLEADDQAGYLGEVALVDKTSGVGQTGVLFGNTLFDENATCHIAVGAGFAFTIDGLEGASPEEQLKVGVNYSAVHTDIMVGGPEITVDGVTRDGKTITIIRDDKWQLGN